MTDFPHPSRTVFIAGIEIAENEVTNRAKAIYEAATRGDDVEWNYQVGALLRHLRLGFSLNSPKEALTEKKEGIRA